MAGPGEDEDKQHEPTQKRLDDARKRGQVPLSQDLTTTGAYGGLILVAAAFGATTLAHGGEVLALMLERPGALAEEIFAGPATRPVGEMILAALTPALPWLALPFAAVLLSVIAQQGLAISGEKIAPKLSRISPLSNAGQKFGRDGIFNFAKSFAKLSIFGALLGIVVIGDLDAILGSLSMSPAGVTELMLRLALRFLAVVFVISLVLGLGDFLWQRAEHIRKNRMSHKELRDESKESEGDPYLKGRRRQRGYEIATNQMLGEVKRADVVIVNPTHYAVALTWDRGGGRAPVCVAKGTDEIAARIREAAAEHGVPVHRDPPTARALHGTLKIGEEVRPDHYRPVAAAIRFADALRKEQRRR
ncbi:MAG: flagellar type III secretion system protein FlhB [Paracoccaceae bacterium]|nr:flagellar type III secretion system protein FlhB [Paracoccaceae bacterium]